MTESRWPEAVLFDLDGTLADSFFGIQAALARALESLGLPQRDVDWVRRHVGRGARPLLEDALGGEHAHLLSALGERFQRLYIATYLDNTPPRQGAAELLALAHANTSGRVAVVSNKVAPLCRTWLEHVGLLRWVALVAGPDTYGAAKPDPAAVLPVLEAFGVPPEAGLLVGDMPIDAETAANAGMASLLVEGGAADRDELRQAHPRSVVGDLGEVREWLLQHARGWGYHVSSEGRSGE